MAMKTEQHHGLPPSEDFGSDNWVEIAGESPHTTPMHDFNGFSYMSPAHMPLDSAHSRSQQHSYFVPQPLHPLNIPQWPSQLTNPSESSPPAQAPTVRPIAPATNIPLRQPARAASVTPAPEPKPHPPPSTARKTLTDNDRRRMCQYHEDNPSVKQTEIGAMFGVERSTVSKVLRQKEKYLSTDDGSRSPVKRSKGKFPDIERALSIWAKNHQKQGLPLNDNMIRDKARFFATTVGSSECHNKVNSGVWLEKFKQKNYLLGCKPQKTSDANPTEGGLTIDSPSTSQTPNGISPISPSQLLPGSPPLKSEDNYLDFGYRNAHSDSVTSLTSCFSEIAPPSCFSPELRSPTSPFFSPDSSCGPSPLVPASSSRLPPLASAASRPRRRTFPTLSGHNPFVPDSDETAPSGRFSQSTMATPTLESPLEEMDQDPINGIDTTMHDSDPTSMHSQSHQTTPTLSRSPSSMHPPPQPPPGNNSTSPVMTGGGGGPPSQDEARRAMETVMAFFEHHQSSSQVDPQEYFLMGKLMEKLKLQQGGQMMPGGMHGLERGDGTLPIGRKRSIHSL